MTRFIARRAMGATAWKSPASRLRGLPRAKTEPPALRAAAGEKNRAPSTAPLKVASLSGAVSIFLHLRAQMRKTRLGPYPKQRAYAE
jgi:hypothetical protein